MEKDYKLPIRENLGDDLNRRSFLADEVCKAMLPKGCYSISSTLTSGMLHLQVWTASSKITYGKYRFLLGLCFRRETERLSKEVDALLTKEAYVA